MSIFEFRITEEDGLNSSSDKGIKNHALGRSFREAVNKCGSAHDYDDAVASVAAKDAEINDCLSREQYWRKLGYRHFLQVMPWNQAV